MFSLFAQTAETAFQFARIQEPRNWFLPVLVAIALLYWVKRRYAKDAKELHPFNRILLLILRIAVILLLLGYYLQPQWDVILSSSRVAILIDTSASMGSNELDPSDQQDDTTPAVRIDGSEIQQTRIGVIVDWLKRSELIDKLRKKHDVVVYRFDTSATRVLQEEKMVSIPSEKNAAKNEQRAAWTAELKANGPETRLGDCLRNVLQRERNQPLSGILLISDGGLNAGDSPSGAIDSAKSAKIPIHTIGIGVKSMPVNFRIVQLDAPERAFPNDPFSIKTRIELQGGRETDDQNRAVSRKVSIECWIARDSNATKVESGIPANAEQIGKQEIELKPGANRNVDFEVKTQDIGKYQLFIRLITSEPEKKVDDNLRQTLIEVVDRKDRALLFAGGPMRDYQFLCGQLNRDKGVKVDAYLPWSHSKASQSVNKLLDAFPSTREEMSQYDCVIAFDPDWRLLSPAQIDIFESWVARQGGGVVLVAGPVNLADTITGWTADSTMNKIRAIYPVDLTAQKLTSVLAYRSDSQPWPIKMTRSGETAEFLRPADTETESRAIWSEFPGFYSFFVVKGIKPTATIYAESSSPDVAGTSGVAPVFVEQFYGAGRVFYIGCGEIWRLRMLNDSYFEKIYTKIIRHVLQGRLQRYSERGSLACDKKRYDLGATAIINATANDSMLHPVTQQNLPLDVVSPDGKVRTVLLAIDPSIPGSYSGFVPLLAEGKWELKLRIPGSDETIVETTQVQMSDLESENPCRDERLLKEIAEKSQGNYYDAPHLALPSGAGTGWDSPQSQKINNDVQSQHFQPQHSIVDLFEVRSQRSVMNQLADERMMRFLLAGLCGLLCCEWLFRRLMRLA